MEQSESRFQQVLDTNHEVAKELIEVRELLKQERQYKMDILVELREQNTLLEARVNELIKKYREQSENR